jgi:hypothetical protein
MSIIIKMIDVWPIKVSGRGLVSRGGEVVCGLPEAGS